MSGGVDSAVAACLLKRDGFVENFEYEARQEDGSRRWFSMNARVSRELEPGNFMIEGFTTDISRQKKLKETLEESERRLRIILEKLPVPALLSSGQLEKVDFINAKFIEVFGYTLEDMPDVHHWWRLAYPDEDYRKKVASEWEENLRRARSEGRELDPVSVQVTCKDGTERFVVIRAYTLGEIHTVVFQDFTDKEMTRKKLEQSVAEKDSLMQELNHRVKNNLLMITSLLSLKEAAMGGSADLSDVRYQIEAIRIIHDKLFHTGSVLEIEIGSYLRDLLNLIFSSFSEKKVRLRIDIEEMRIKTRTAIPLGLIVNEIATNAVKYGFTTAEEPGFTISLKEDPSEGRCVLILSNTGEPFPERVGLDNPDTLGMQLITTLVSQLRGTLDLRRAPCPQFTIKFFE